MATGTGDAGPPALAARLPAYALALVGLGLLVLPASLFVLYALAPSGVAHALGLGPFLVLLGVGWIGGPPFALAGTTRLGRLARPDLASGRRRPGALLGVAGVVALALALLLLAGFATLVFTCDSTCSNPLGAVGDAAQSARLCGQPCAVNVAGLLVGPTPILAGAATLGLAGTVLAAFGVGRAVDALPSAPRRRGSRGDRHGAPQ